jgi:hypothetical protein
MVCSLGTVEQEITKSWVKVAKTCGARCSPAFQHFGLQFLFEEQILQKLTRFMSDNPSTVRPYEVEQRPYIPPNRKNASGNSLKKTIVWLCGTK